MDITFKDFVAVCPSAMTPSAEVFKAVEPLIADRLAFVKGVVTPAIFSKLENVENDPLYQDSERLGRLGRDVKAYVCASAYHLAIPQLDLVLTPNGFGVVSNQNVAPASADRVAALRKAVHIAECAYLDEIIDALRPLVDWSDSTHGRYFFNNLFWRGEHVRRFGVPNATRGDLVERWPDIEAAAREMAVYFSPELYRALLKAESTASATPMQQSLIIMWRAATVEWCRHDGSWIRSRNAMLRFIEDNIDEFPEYRDSQTYKAKNMVRYENKKDDSCFFFG